MTSVDGARDAEDTGPTLRLGTRRSALALAQSGMIADAITAATGRLVELVPIVSEGDTNRASLSQIGGTGVFATRLREALRAGECDLLVHSLKDLPTQQPDDLVLAALPAREDARDVLVTRGPALADLGASALVGTGSPRRIAQLRRRNPRVEPRDLRGNVDSRLGRVRSGELDGVLLAAAGLERLQPDLDGLALEHLGLADWPTAAGQGVLGVEARAEASDVLRVLSVLDDPLTRFAATIERSVLAVLEAGCHAPVGVHAEVTPVTPGIADVRVRAIVYARDGSTRIGADDVQTLHIAPPTGPSAPREGYHGEQDGRNGAGAARTTEPLLTRPAAHEGEPIAVAPPASSPAEAERIGAQIATRLLQRGAAELVS